MKRSAFIYCIALFLFSGSWAKAGDVNFGGFIKLDKRFMIEESEYPFVGMYNTLRLETAAYPADNLKAFASTEVRYYDFSDAETTADLSELDSTEPIDFTLWEGYLEIYDFLIPGLDVKAGKQRIAWGTADKLNPTDNLNPDDFSDPLDFGEKVPSTALLATYYLKDFEFSYVWLPAMRPALMPKGGMSLFSPEDMFSFPPGAGISVVDYRDHVIEPEEDIEHSMHGFKVKGAIEGVDLSLSYFSGFDDLPIPSDILIDPLDPLDPTKVRLEPTMTFPRMDVIGFDVAGEAFTVGYWAEFAAFFPQEVTMNTHSNDPALQAALTGMGMGETVVLEDEPYYKYAIGFDYTFEWKMYVNCQYMHGFFHERGEDNLEDYILARVEQDFLRDTLKVSLGGGMEINDDNDQGNIVIPEVSYKPMDAVELTVGAFFLEGENGTLFGDWKEMDQLYVKGRVDF
ncbi:MAG: hypothetical protein JRI22_15935 [Deltaproteobacteria bacterium]|nr:hypothetical protein [Deltaproteobacteria bacterium]